ncbi:MAG: hypothetical protein K6F44_00730 [Lachnospiraceae bacterium]|nr:hypothetical protein [Lachnospiraceae bacterium]
MDRVINIALDVSGSAEQISERIAGCVGACSEHEDINLILLGDMAYIENALGAYGPLKDRIRIVHVTQEINESDALVAAVRDKQDSALVKGLKLVKSGEAGAFLSCMASKQLSDAAQIALGKIERLSISPIATLVPGLDKHFLLIDTGSAGSNVRPSDFVLFAKMGSLYMRYLVGERRPLVKLLSDSDIPENGGTLYRESYELLRRGNDVNFGGTIRPEELWHGKADVIVCDGFTGGLVLGLMAGLVKDIASVSVSRRKYLLFGRTKDQDKDMAAKLGGLSSRGMSFFPGLKGNVVSLSGRTHNDTLQKAIGYSVRLIRDDVRGRLISNLKL